MKTIDRPDPSNGGERANPVPTVQVDSKNGLIHATRTLKSSQLLAPISEQVSDTQDLA